MIGSFLIETLQASTLVVASNAQARERGRFAGLNDRFIAALMGMQRLAYLGFGVLIMPVIWVSGLLYMFYADWPSLGLDGLPLGLVAGIHVAAAFALLAFLIAHVYMGFTGKPWYSYPKAMITGATMLIPNGITPGAPTRARSRSKM